MLVRCLAIALCFFASSVHADGKFRVGVAQIDVTPTKPMPMWGYGARHDLLSRGMRDPLYAKAVVIESGDSRLAIVGLDLGRSLGEPHFSRIREAVKKASHVDHIMMSGSHSHHGPVLELKDAPGQGRGKFDDAVAYVGELEKKLIQVINDAAGNLQDAKIGWSSAQVDMNRNRHSKREPKPRDTELAVIRLDDTAGKPIAIIVNFAAHPTILAGTDLRWSAEYPGAMMRLVESTMDTKCIFIQGSAGDMSPQTIAADSPPGDDPSLKDEALDPELAKLLKSSLKIDDAKAKELQRDMISSGQRLESFGRRLGEQVLQLAKQCTTKVPDRPGITGKYEELVFESRVDFQSLALRALFAVAFFPELASAASSEYKDNKIHAALTTVLLNNELALVGGSGEFFCDHSLRLKERSYYAKTLFFGYCNGHQMYFPTIEAVSQGGYGADAQVSWVELGAGERMMNQALINIFQMQGKISNSLLAP